MAGMFGGGAPPRPTNPMDALGYLPGQLHLNPAIAPQVAPGLPRPFAPGEYMTNPNGSWSSEMSYTVADPTLNNAMPTNIPGLWIVNGRPYHATEDEAARFAAQSGLQWPTYQRTSEADAAAAEREKDWQKMSPQQAINARPLYVQPGLLTPQK